MKFSKILLALTIAAIAAAVPIKHSYAQESFIGEIIWVGFNFCPRSFAPAAGQILPISQNQALFSLLGTSYGGDGRTTFALPDLRGRTAISQGRGPGLSDVRIGATGGAAQIVLNTNQVPSHIHKIETGVPVTSAGPKKDPYARASTAEVSIAEVGTASLQQASTIISKNGNSNPVDIRTPFIGIQACIAINGIFPSRN